MQIKTDDGHKSVASQAVGGTALGLAIPGTLAFLNQVGGIGGFFGNNQAATTQCNDTRMISALESEIAMLKSERYTDQVGTEVYAEINKKYVELAQFIAALDKQNAVAEAINLPEGQKVGALVAIGYPAEEPAAPARKEADQLVQFL